MVSDGIESLRMLRNKLLYLLTPFFFLTSMTSSTSQELFYARIVNQKVDRISKINSDSNRPVREIVWIDDLKFGTIEQKSSGSSDVYIYDLMKEETYPITDNKSSENGLVYYKNRLNFLASNGTKNTLFTVPVGRYAGTIDQTNITLSRANSCINDGTGQIFCDVHNDGLYKKGSGEDFTKIEDADWVEIKGDDIYLIDENLPLLQVRKFPQPDPTATFYLTDKSESIKYHNGGLYLSRDLNIGKLSKDNAELVVASLEPIVSGKTVIDFAFSPRGDKLLILVD